MYPLYIHIFLNIRIYIYIYYVSFLYTYTYSVTYIVTCIHTYIHTYIHSYMGYLPPRTYHLTVATLPRRFRLVLLALVEATRGFALTACHRCTLRRGSGDEQRGCHGVSAISARNHQDFGRNIGMVHQGGSFGIRNQTHVGVSMCHNPPICFFFFARNIRNDAP